MRSFVPSFGFGGTIEQPGGQSATLRVPLRAQPRYIDGPLAWRDSRALAVIRWSCARLLAYTTVGYAMPQRWCASKRSTAAAFQD